MEADLKYGLLAALMAGCMFAVIVTLEGVVSKVVGGFFASVFEHFFAGLVAFTVVGFVLVRRNINWSEITPILPLSMLLGFLVFAAVATIAYAIPRTGVALGNFVLVFGQLVLTVVIDTMGIGGLERVPLTPQRIVGLLVMVAGTYLVFYKKG